MWPLACSGGLLLAALAAPAWEPRYYTPERVAVGRENVARHAWGQAVLSRIRKGDADRYYIGREYAPADTYAAQTDELIWTLQPSTRIARVFPAESEARCPQHGLAVRQHNAFHPWGVDPIGHPYQLQCPIGHEWYPSNHFAAGDLTSGPYADSGDGFTREGVTYYFLRDYAHRVYGNTTIPLLRSLSQAWLLTGDRAYAHKGSLLLARLASEYPNYTDRADRLYFARYGGRSPTYSWKTGGMITDLIWETFCLEATAFAFDALAGSFDADAELLAFVRAKGLPVTDGESLRQYVRESLFRPAMQALLKGDIRGNEGFHQAAALAVALVMDDYSAQHPNSLDLVDYAFHGAGHSAWMMVNGLWPDGGGHESLGYNAIKLDFVRVNRLMEQVRRRHPERYPVDRYPDLFGERKALAVYDWFIDSRMLDYWIQEIGDCGGNLAPRRVGRQSASYLSSENLYAFQRTGSPRYARACVAPDGKLYPGELWEPYPLAALEAALRQTESRLARRSRLLDGYGQAILETGDGDQARAVSVNYSSLLGHWQADSLFLSLFAHGLSYLPDLGYPFGWANRTQWDANSLAHNTVTVDETQFAYGWRGGLCRLLAETEGLHVLTVAHDPYPAAWEPQRRAAQGVDTFERTVVMVGVSPETFYTVDVFDVRGGEQHDQSWHGPQVPMVLPADVHWTPQPGTLAGEAVPQFGRWSDRWGRQRDDFPGYLTGLRRATIGEPAVFAQSFGLPGGEGLRLHLVPVDGPLTVYAGHGRSPARPTDWRLDYLIARRTGPPGLATRFVTVLDTHAGQPVVSGVRVTGNDPLTLTVSRAGGRDVIEIERPTGPSRGTAPRALGVTVRHNDGETRVGGRDGWARGRVTAADYAANQVTVTGDAALADQLMPGRYLRVYNAARSGMMRIRAVRREGDQWVADLAGTPLLARGPVTATSDGRLTVGAYLLYGGARLDAAQQVIAGSCAYAGAVVSDGRHHARVAGVLKGESSTVLLTEKTPAAQLAKDFGGKIVSVWQYGVGDQVELATIRRR